MHHGRNMLACTSRQVSEMWLCSGLGGRLAGACSVDHIEEHQGKDCASSIRMNRQLLIADRPNYAVYLHHAMCFYAFHKPMQP